MATIKIKRGLKENVDALTLAEGELAVATDSGDLYVGTTSGKLQLNASQTSVEKATQLVNSKNFSITGDGTAPAVAFNGTQNVALSLTLANSGVNAGTYTKVTVDAKGRVTGSGSIALADLPSIPTSKITGLGSAATKSTGTSAGNVVVVSSDGKIDGSLIPSIAVTDVFEAADQKAMLELTALQGDICVRTDEGKSYILKASPASTLANWVWLKTPDCKVVSVAGKTGAVTLSKSDVGLGSVDNTADSAKSVAKAAQLTTARTIALSGAATGTATSFNGTENITIPVTAIDGTKVTGKVPSAVAADTATSATSATSATTATKATQLANSRNFSIKGGATAAAVAFSGTGNVELNVTSLDASKLSGTIDGGTF